MTWTAARAMWLKTFDTVSHNTLIHKLRKRRIHEWTVKWIKNWQSSEGCDQWLRSCSCRPVASGVSQGTVLGPVLFNISIKNLNEQTDCTHSKFAEPPFSETWTGLKVRQRSFNRGKCRVLHLGKNNYTDQQVTWGAGGCEERGQCQGRSWCVIRTREVRFKLKVWLRLDVRKKFFTQKQGVQLNKLDHKTLQQWSSTAPWAASGRVPPADQGKWSFPSIHRWWGRHLGYWSSSEFSPDKEKEAQPSG